MKALPRSATRAFSYTWGKADAIKAVLNVSQTGDESRTIAADFDHGLRTKGNFQLRQSRFQAHPVDNFDDDCDWHRFIQYISTGINVTLRPA